MIVNKLYEFVSLDPGGEVIYLDKDTPFCLCHDWEKRKDSLLESLLKIPHDVLHCKSLMLPLLGNDELQYLILLAIGEQMGFWERFPILECEWNLPHWPTIHIKSQHLLQQKRQSSLQSSQRS